MMASVYRQYENSNFSVLANSLLRGEFLYGIKLFAVQQSFMSEQGSVLRMRVSLACIEAGAVVIDAYVQVDGNISYLFVLCSSFLSPDIFSKTVTAILPQAEIDCFYKNQAETYLMTSSEQHLTQKPIPFFAESNINSDANNLLISLLIEYKAILLDNKKTGLLAACLQNKNRSLLAEAIEIRKYSSADLNLNIMLFQKDGLILALPVFQIKKIDKDVFQKKYIQILPEYGGEKIYVEDIFLLKKIDLSKASFLKKIDKGIYEIEIQSIPGKFKFNFVVPMLMKRTKHSEL